MAEISFGTRTGVRPQAAAQDSGDGPMRMLVIGDFSGRVGGDGGSAARPLVVDRDNLDAVLAKLDVRLENLVAGEGVPPVNVEIRAMEDFHPDALFDKLEIFASLRQMRRRLTNASTFASAAAEVRAWGAASAANESKPAAPTSTPADDAPRSEYSVEGLFDMTLGATAAAPARDEAANWRDMIREIAAPFALSGTAAEEKQLTDVVDRVVSETMRTILRHERFHAVEMAWRGLEFLTRRIETDESLKVFALDMSADAVAHDMMAGDDLGRSTLYRLLVDESVNTPGGKPWGAVLVFHRYDARARDAEVLARLACLASAAGAPVIAGVHERVAGCPNLYRVGNPDDWTWVADQSAQAMWKALAGMSESAYLGLALPRVLMRLPYGATSNPTERFRFEELPENATDAAGRHARLAWGPAAAACGALLGASFAANGWRMTPGDDLEIDGLPMFVDKVDDEAVAVPCAEALLTDRAVEKLMARGLIPLVPYRDTDHVRAAGFRSIRGLQERLAGRWR